jgi:hypothetical protein
MAAQGFQVGDAIGFDAVEDQGGQPSCSKPFLLGRDGETTDAS